MSKRKIVRIVSLAMAVIIALIPLSACAPSATTTAAPTAVSQQAQPAAPTATSPSIPKMIGMLFVDYKEARYSNADGPAVEAEAKALGYTTSIQSAENDSEKQILQAESMLNQGIRILILQAKNIQAGSKIVQEAKNDGAIVISYNDLIQNAPIDGFVGRDSHQLGVDSATKMIALYPKGNYVIVGGDQGASVAQDMTRGYHDVLDKNTDIKIVSEQWNAGWSADSSIKQAENALTANNDNIQAVLSNNDGMATGVMQALSSAGLLGKVGLSGQDLELTEAQAIVAGNMTFTAFTEYTQMGKDAVDLAVALAEGRELPKHTTANNGSVTVPWIQTQVLYITKDNMCEFLKGHTWWLKITDVYAKEAANSCQ